MMSGWSSAASASGWLQAEGAGGERGFGVPGEKAHRFGADGDVGEGDLAAGLDRGAGEEVGVGLAADGDVAGDGEAVGEAGEKFGRGEDCGVAVGDEGVAAGAEVAAEGLLVGHYGRAPRQSRVVEARLEPSPAALTRLRCSFAAPVRV